MSLEQRCQQFHEAATSLSGNNVPSGAKKSKGPIKEISTLRKFLHRNQDQRFTDKAVSRLFDTIQIYIHHKEEGKELDRELKEGLLEDALKMPFTVFSTKQKKSMLKWLENIRGEGGEGQTCETTQVLSLIDFNDGPNPAQLSLMDDDTGDLFENVPLPAGELGTRIKDAFASTTGTVSLEVVVQDANVTKIVKLCQD